MSTMQSSSKEQNVKYHADENKAYEELEAKHVLAPNRCSSPAKSSKS